MIAKFEEFMLICVKHLVFSNRKYLFEKFHINVVFFIERSKFAFSVNYFVKI